jgi:hypothetical protein
VLELGVSFVLALHLMCVNVAAAGPLVCVWLDWRAASDDLARRAGRFLAISSIALLLVGGGLGIAIAGLLWNDAYHDLMHAFSYKIVWGAWELLFSVVLMAVYAVVVAIAPARRIGWRLLRASIAVLAATNLLYHFPTLFIAISEVGAGYLDGPPRIDAAAFRQMMAESSVLARSVHFWLASIAVTGITLVAYARWLQRSEDEMTNGGRLATWGARIALVPTLLQILVGVWLLSVLPASMQQRMLGEDLMAASLLGLSIIAALWLMHQLSAVAMGDTKPKSLNIAILLMCSVVLLMTMASRRALAESSVAAKRMQEIEHGP